METTYFVSYKLYNTTSKGWAYKTELQTTDFELAMRKYGELIKTYYGLSPFGFGCIDVQDNCSNVLKKETWNVEFKTETTEDTETKE